MHGLSELSPKIQELVESEGFQLWSLDVDHDNLLRVSVDKIGGITIGECSLVGRRIKLMVEDDPTFSYRLEVSSPGLSRALKTSTHYEQSVGLTIECRVRDDEGKKLQYEGSLLSVSSTGIVLQQGLESREILFSNIEKARRVA